MTDTATPPLVWTVADKLRKARTHAGMEPDELGIRLGVSERTIRNYEMDGWHRRPRLLTLWADTCGVPLEWLTRSDDEVSTLSTWMPLIPGQHTERLARAA